MASSIIHRLRCILEGTETFEEELREIHLSRESRMELDLISDRIRALANTIGKKTGSLKTVPQNEAWEKSKEQREKASSTLANVLTQQKLTDLRVFRKNLITIFNGPDRHKSDTSAMITKKNVTEERCKRLQRLSVDGIISWAIVYPSASWAGGVMSKDIFQCLVEDIEPRDILDWPVQVNEILQELQQKQIQTDAFKNLVEGQRDPSRQSPMDDAAVFNPDVFNPNDQQPNKRNRETKYMFTDAPAALLEKLLPQPFRRCVMNSNQWRWERSEGFSTTSCVNTLFPRSEKDDVSVTLWVGHDDGYRLNNMFNVTRYSS